MKKQMDATIAAENSALIRFLLTCGIVSAPLFCVVVFTQFFTRPGADIHRLPLSLLSLGDFGWIQIRLCDLYYPGNYQPERCCFWMGVCCCSQASRMKLIVNTK